MNISLDDIRQDITRTVRIALEEDIGSGDVTAMLIPEDQSNVAEVITREDCVVCGVAWFNETFEQLGGVDEIRWHVSDGDFVEANTKLVTVKGNTRTLLTGERTALNFLQALSGTATRARQYAKLVEGTEIKILDTRKTIPGLRTAQKYAVNIGGCHNHRIGLFDAFLIKENHIAACGDIAAAVARAREIGPGKLVEVEVESLDQLRQAIDAGADVIMLDNFNHTEIITAVEYVRGRRLLEISGNISAETLQKFSPKGINLISVGDITKNVTVVDLSMQLKN